MILLRRILPFLSPALVALFLSILIIDPIEWRRWVFAIAAVLVISTGLMTHWHILSSDFWAMLFPALTLFGGGIGVLFFADIIQLQWGIAISLIVLFALYMENMFVFYYQPQKYTVLSLPNLSFFINVFAAFGLFSFGYALDLINALSLWVIIVSGSVYALLFFFHVMWSYKLLKVQHLSAMGVMTLVMIELIWVLQYWPVAFYIQGVVIAVAFFLLSSFMQLSLRQVLERKMIWQYAILSIVSISAILSTARWLS